MAKGRFLSKSVSISQKLALLKSDSARLLWTWLLPHLDREGRFHADPGVVKGHAVPRLKGFTEKTIGEILGELADVGLILLYDVNGDAYLQYTQFDENQPGLRKDREAESSCPPPPDKLRSKSGVSPEEVRTNSAVACGQALKYKDKLLFNLQGRVWEGISVEDMESWAKAYPACDVSTELAKAGEWIIANPAKGKKSNYRRFLVNWLSRQQERGGTTRTASLAPRRNDYEAAIDAVKIGRER